MAEKLNAENFEAAAQHLENIQTDWKENLM